MLKIALLGRTQMLYATAQLLHAQGYQICAVLTTPAAPEYTRNATDFAALAAEFGATFIQTNNLDDPAVATACQGLDAAVSVNWQSVVQARHIDWFRLGVLNAHHGDLPRYRGNACSNWAILMGENAITTSIHLMEGGVLDCGRVLVQETLHLTDQMSVSDVYQWSEERIPHLFLAALQALAQDPLYTLKYADPHDPAAFRGYPRLPQDSFIDWTQPARAIHNLVRASAPPFSGAYTFHWQSGAVRKLHILRSQVAQHHSTDLAMPGQVLRNQRSSGASHIQCGTGILAVYDCRYADEAEPFLAGQRWRSIRLRLGVRPEDWLWAIQQAGVRQSIP
jgi:methionyl-tRNA formyltransferase